VATLKRNSKSVKAALADVVAWKNKCDKVGREEARRVLVLQEKITSSQRQIMG
jgi:hypothetical protein